LATVEEDEVSGNVGTRDGFVGDHIVVEPGGLRDNWPRGYAFDRGVVGNLYDRIGGIIARVDVYGSPTGVTLGIERILNPRTMAGGGGMELAAERGQNSGEGRVNKTRRAQDIIFIVGWGCVRKLRTRVRFETWIPSCNKVVSYFGKYKVAALC
jgi:hypothetical protein